MKRKWLVVISALALSLACLCGCAKTCDNCGNEIDSDSGTEIEDGTYCDNCVAYCEKCNKPCLKDDGSLITYKKHEYCEECFEEEAYPISLFSNKKMSVSIVGYDDEEGLFAVQIKNKTKYELCTYQDGDKALMDGKDSCIGETSGSHSFAYATVPAKETSTVFCSFRKSIDEWDTIYKPSEGHAFELTMNAYSIDGKYWDESFKISLEPSMFGY